MWEQNVLKNVYQQMSSSEVYGSVSEKLVRKKWRLLNTGEFEKQGEVVTTPSVVRALQLCDL